MAESVLEKLRNQANSAKTIQSYMYTVSSEYLFIDQIIRCPITSKKIINEDKIFDGNFVKNGIENTLRPEAGIPPKIDLKETYFKEL